MEKDERAVHVELMGEKEMLTAILGNAEVQKPRRKTRHRFEDDINVKKWDGRAWTGFIWLRTGTKDCCEYGEFL